jgi:dTDP-4-dehydrorhamnose 3,5-epimerase-like enzyme
MRSHFFRPKINFADERGYIKDLIYKNSINHITIIGSKKNTIRGNHFHKKTIQYTYILKGELIYFWKNLKRGEVSQKRLKFGSLIKTPRNLVHAFKFLKSTQILVFSSGLRGGRDYIKDTYSFKIVL